MILPGIKKIQNFDPRMRFFILTLSVVYIFSATELHEALKLPLLFEHYAEHKALNKGLTFIDFLNHHYSDDGTVSPDYDKDMKLPFKSDDKNIITTNFISFQNTCCNLLTPPVIESEPDLPQNIGLLIEGFNSVIWQPPKV